MTNSKTYRSQNVQAVKLEAVLAGHDGESAVVGVDVGKEKLYLTVRWPDGRTERPVVVNQPEELGMAMEFLKKLGKDRKLRVALEPSGTYGDAFRYACHRVGLAVERVSPVASKRHAEVYDGSPSQHDGKDPGVIAELAAMGKSAVWAWVEASEQVQMLAAHAALMDNYQEEVNAWRGRLEGKLARHWPEVVDLLDLDSVTLLEALIRYGAPAKLAEDPQAGERLATWGGPLLTEEKIAAVVQSARTSRGVPVGVGERYHLQQIAGRLLESKRRLEHHHRELEKQSQGLATVQVAGAALGNATMGVLHLAAGNPGSYTNGRAYQKALGLNLVERSSGKYQGRLHISKRGSAVARRWLYLAALRVLKDPGVQPWYEAKVRRDGGHKGKAVTAVMRKLALGIQHCASTGEVFACGKLFQKQTRKRSGRGRHRGRPVTPAEAAVGGAAVAPAAEPPVPTRTSGTADGPRAHRLSAGPYRR